MKNKDFTKEQEEQLKRVLDGLKDVDHCISIYKDFETPSLSEFGGSLPLVVYFDVVDSDALFKFVKENCITDEIFKYTQKDEQVKDNVCSLISRLGRTHSFENSGMTYDDFDIAW